MNELSNFCTGECGPENSKKIPSDGFNPTNPPYSIHNNGNNLEPLNTKTLDPTAGAIFFFFY